MVTTTLEETSKALKQQRRNHYTRKHVSSAYRSGLEEKTAAFLRVSGFGPVEYEQYTISYTIPPRQTKYTPDFVLPNGIIIETKGLFLPDDRQKHLLIKDQHPDLDIRFVFTNSHAKLYKGSPTSYATWCEKFGFQYSQRSIPKEWLFEASTEKRTSANKTIMVKRRQA